MNGQEGRRQTRENKGNCDNSASCPRLHSIWLYTNLLPMCMSSRLPLYVHEVDFLCVICPLDFLCMCVFCIVLCCWYVLCSVRVFMLCLFVTLCVYVYARVPVNMYMYVSLFMRHMNNITNTQNDKLNKAKLKRKQSLFRRKFPIPPVLSHQSDHEQEQL